MSAIKVKMFALAVVLLIAAFSLPWIPAYADDDRSDRVQERHDRTYDRIDEDERAEKENEAPYEEVLKWIGKLAVVSGALSLSWYLMKRKRASKIKPVRKVAHLFYRYHLYAGFGALVLVLVHGAFFLVYERLEDDTVTGLIAFLLLVALAIYGLIVNRTRLANHRKAHFALAVVWAMATVIHAGDAIPLFLFVTGASYGLLWWLERRSELHQMKSIK